MNEPTNEPGSKQDKPQTPRNRDRPSRKPLTREDLTDEELEDVVGGIGEGFEFGAPTPLRWPWE